MAKRKIHWYWGCGWDRAYSHDFSASQFLTDASKNPDWFCVTCATKARLALAKESAPKPDTRTDSDRYAELRKLVEDCQREAMDSASPVVMFDNALRLVLDWRHR